MADKVTKKQLGRFANAYNSAPDNAKDIALKLIQNALFMEEQLEILQDDIRQNGVAMEYKNGQNQFGMKRSPAMESYTSMIKNYTTVTRQLADLLPMEGGQADELVSFLGGGGK